jgi:transposase InsO family protein
MRAELVCAALAMAARNHRLEPGCIFHSDRGVRYTSALFARTCKRLDVRRSMGRTGVCWDNALAESFNAALKVERVHRVVYINRQAAYRDIAQYIEIRYNRQRRHSGLGYRIPLQIHYEYFDSQASA